MHHTYFMFFFNIRINTTQKSVIIIKVIGFYFDKTIQSFTCELQRSNFDFEQVICRRWASISAYYRYIICVEISLRKLLSIGFISAIIIITVKILLHRKLLSSIILQNSFFYFADFVNIVKLHTIFLKYLTNNKNNWEV